MVRSNEKGTILLVTTVIVGLVLTFVLSGLIMVRAKVCEAEVIKVNLQSSAIADSGIEKGIHWVRDAMKIWGTFEPFDAIDSNQADGIDNNATLMISAGTSDGILTDSLGNKQGEYDVFADVTDRSSSDSRLITLHSRGYVPSKAAVLNQKKGASCTDSYTRLQIRQIDGKAGNYSYFINNWGWFYGSSITSNGSDRSNAKFTMRYDPTIEASAIYNEAKGSDLIDKLNDGGVFAGLNIDGTCRGSANCEENQYEYQDPILMPNLSDLSIYKKEATKSGSTISAGGTEFTNNGVYGDEAGEKENLYLVGTQADPIQINGTIVVDGALVIKGYITGKGKIITKDNLYIAGDIKYLNGPATPRPPAGDEASTEQWIAANMDKDFVGLYAGENIVMGDMSDSTWQSYVFSWLNDDDNRSDEDCGQDRIQGTGDTGENDGSWDVEHFTQAQQDMGLIPSGYNVGDPIPGTGEDIDGDGQYDQRITTKGEWQNVFKTSTSINSEHWGGTLPDHGFSRKYNEIATNNISHIDGCLYTNHALAGLLLGGSKTVQMNGAIISRNESIVYSPRIEMNHDERLTGRSWQDLGIVGGGGKVWDDITVQAYWTNNSEDNY